MLSDRSYMRDPFRRQGYSLVAWMIGLMVAVFVLQEILRVAFASTALVEYGALSTPGLRKGFAWTFVTYALFHQGVLHLLFNGLILFFMGRQLEMTLGPRRLLHLSIFATLLAGFAWWAVNFRHPNSAVIGASGIATAYIVAFASQDPRRPITLLLFFVLPITMRAFWLIVIVGGVSVVGLLSDELSGNSSHGAIAHSAHLGGMLAGWLYHRFLNRETTPLFGREPDVELPRWFKKTVENPNPVPAYKVNVPSRENIRAEVDRILDKINSDGFASLTDEERRVLDEAHDILSRN